MDTKEVIATIALAVSCIGLIPAIWAFISTRYHNATLREHNLQIRQYASAAPETAVLAQINQGRMRVGDISLKLQELLKGRLPNALNADEKRQIQGMETIYHEAIEVLLNTYELACGMYRDKKLDRERFKKQYGDEIKKMFEQGTAAYKSRLEPFASPYKAIRAVYDEWFNQEKY